MADLKPELSTKNQYWISKHRYYELKHFCLQYPTWKKAHDALDGLSKRPEDLMIFKVRHGISDPTGNCAVSKAAFREKMFMIEESARQADPELASYILKAVTEGLSYENLQAMLIVPCSRETYYDRYRKFFWHLNRLRD